jgi:hypothetical protein
MQPVTVAMTDPISRARFHPDLNLETWFPEGVLDVLVGTFMAHYIGFEEAVASKPFNRFTDFTGLTAIRLEMEDIANIVALRRASYQDRPPVKSAILAVAAPAYGVARMFAALMESSPIEVRVFRTVEEAAHWLGVPVAALRADSAGLGHAAQPHP